MQTVDQAHTAVPDTTGSSNRCLTNIAGSKRKLVICCDGTWNNSDISNLPLTNVARMTRCIKPFDHNGVPQIVYYQSGIGTGTSKISNVREGATGRGESKA
jgi:uncharacterized protein (DUF2235 family)